MILKNLFRRKTRSLLTMFGIAIGIGAMVALNAIGAGLASGETSLFSTSGADLSLSQADATDMVLSAVNEEVGEQVRAMPQVQGVAGVIYNMVSLDGIPYFLIFGYDPKEFAIEHFKIVEGRGLQGSREIVIGRAASRNLSKGLGATVQFLGNTFRIVGIFETGSPFEEAGGVIIVKDAQMVFQKPRQVSLFQIKLRNPRDLNLVRDRLKARYPDLAVSVGGRFEQFEQYYQLTQGFAVGIGLIAVLVGGLGMMNTIMMSVFERTREIGTLRAVGWGQRRILAMILGEALLLSIVGGILGMGLGVVLVKLLGSFRATAGLLIGQFTPDVFIMAVITALALGALGGLYPAWRAAKLQPVEALRYEGGATGSTDKGTDKRMAWSRFMGMMGRNLLRRRSRTVLTTLGIGIGVMVVVALGAITEGMISQFSALLGSGGAELTVMQAKVADMSLSAIDERVGKRIAALPDVESVSGAVWGFVANPDVPFLFGFGLDPEEFIIRDYKIKEGRRIQSRSEMILGRTAAENLKKHVGDVMRVSGAPFKIVGIFETGVGYQDVGGVIDLREAQSLFNKPRQVAYYGIKLKNPNRADAVIAEIRARIPEVAVSRSTEFAENTQDLKVTKALMWVLSSIGIVVGGVGVMNTILMSVFERTREIGVLRALGWRRRRILEQIMGESLLLSLLGGVIGIGIGVGLTLLLSRLPWGEIIEGQYPLWLFGLAMGTALTLGVVGGIYPAWRATQFQPAEALRYE